MNVPPGMPGRMGTGAFGSALPGTALSSGAPFQAPPGANSPWAAPRTNNWFGLRGLFFEPEAYQDHSEFAFSGAGHGAYEPVQSYKYVGEGMGRFNKEVYQGAVYGWQPRKCVLCVLLSGCFLPLLVAYGLWLFREMPKGSTVAAGLAPPTMWAAELGRLQAPASVGSNSLPVQPGNLIAGDWVQVGAPSSSMKEVQAVSATGPPVQLLATLAFAYPAGTPVFKLFPQATVPYNCAEGAANSAKSWSEAKKDWCCINQNAGCPFSGQLQFDCANVMATSPDAQKDFCCMNTMRGCEALPSGVTLPPVPPVLPVPTTSTASTTPMAIVTTVMADRKPAKPKKRPRPKPTTAPPMSAAEACNQVCVMGAVSATCKAQAARLAKDPLNMIAGAWEACASGTDQVLEECDQCQGCTKDEACADAEAMAAASPAAAVPAPPGEVFAPTPAPDDAAAVVERDAASPRGYFECGHQCEYQGVQRSCKETISFVLENEADPHHDPCDEAYAAVSQQCRICKGCTADKAECAKPQPGDPFNCTKTETMDRKWSGAKKAWCCYRYKIACETAAAHAAAPQVAVPVAQAPAPTAAPLPPKPPAPPSTSVQPATQVAAETAESAGSEGDLYSCDQGPWPPLKKKYCCEKKSLGCDVKSLPEEIPPPPPGTPPPEAVAALAAADAALG